VSTDLPLYLRRRQAGFAGTSVGRLLVHDVEQGQRPGTLALHIEFFPDAESSRPDAPTYWVSLAASIRSQHTPAQEVGTVRVGAANQPPFPPTPPNMQLHVKWDWELLPSDVEILERSRLSNPAAPFYVQLFVEGVIQTQDGVFGVEGNASIKIEQSQWQRLMQQTGYSVAPSGLVSLSGAAIGDTAWLEAIGRLMAARSHLQRGEGYAALEACLDQLEAIVTNPYQPEAWKQRFVGLPEQKADSLARWIAGHATYLNRVGHHRDRQERDDQGDLVAMPLNQWEAELVVASTQFLLAYVLRLPGV
jgi:hypothetical protein